MGSDGQASEQAAFVIAFESTHAAMASQTAFKKAGVTFALIPTPREISAGCGMSIRFKAASPSVAQGLIDSMLSPDVKACSSLYDANGYAKIA